MGGKLNRTILTYAEIVKGGKIVFEMNTHPPEA
jgi:hypothetical protein